MVHDCTASGVTTVLYYDVETKWKILSYLLLSMDSPFQNQGKMRDMHCGEKRVHSKLKPHSDVRGAGF